MKKKVGSNFRDVLNAGGGRNKVFRFFSDIVCIRYLYKFNIVMVQQLLFLLESGSQQHKNDYLETFHTSVCADLLHRLLPRVP
jgi:hypothetical protein